MWEKVELSFPSFPPFLPVEPHSPLSTSPGDEKITSGSGSTTPPPPPFQKPRKFCAGSLPPLGLKRGFDNFSRLSYYLESPNHRTSLFVFPRIERIFSSPFLDDRYGNFSLRDLGPVFFYRGAQKHTFSLPPDPRVPPRDMTPSTFQAARSFWISF